MEKTENNQAEKKSDTTKLLLVFLLGAAAGAAVGYLAASGKKDELINDLKATAGKVKEGIKNTFDKGKKLADDISKETDDFLGI